MSVIDRGYFNPLSSPAKQIKPYKHRTICPMQALLFCALTLPSVFYFSHHILTIKKTVD